MVKAVRRYMRVSFEAEGANHSYVEQILGTVKDEIVIALEKIASIYERPRVICIFFWEEKEGVL